MWEWWETIRHAEAEVVEMTDLSWYEVDGVMRRGVEGGLERRQEQAGFREKGATAEGAAATCAWGTRGTFLKNRLKYDCKGCPA